MPDTGLITASIVCLIAAVGFVLFPHPLLAISQSLNRTLVTLDERLIRYRYLCGLALFIVSYLCFRLALLVPGLKG